MNRQSCTLNGVSICLINRFCIYFCFYFYFVYLMLFNRVDSLHSVLTAISSFKGFLAKPYSLATGSVGDEYMHFIQ